MSRVWFYNIMDCFHQKISLTVKKHEAAEIILIIYTEYIE